MKLIRHITRYGALNAGEVAGYPDDVADRFVASKAGVLVEKSKDGKSFVPVGQNKAPAPAPGNTPAQAPANGGNNTPAPATGAGAGDNTPASGGK